MQLCARAGRQVPIIVKIETQEALEEFDDILAETDAVMIARGDLAVEVDTEMVPLYQKDIIKKCTQAGKAVITATQMLESMIHSPTPSRAEVSDVANAIVDGTDAVMLSEESALGQYPVEAVSMMARIARTIEKDLEKRALGAPRSIQDSVTHAVCSTAEEVDAALIIALTESGTTAQMIARFRPATPIIALTPHQETVQKLQLTRGARPYLTDTYTTLDESLGAICQFVTERSLAQKGDAIVVAAGLSFGVSGSTNMLTVLRI